MSSGATADPADVPTPAQRGDATNRTKPHSVQAEFLPAALEIQDAPPSPLGHLILWVLVSLSTAAVVWAAFGHVDIVVSAPGRIIPNGQVKTVQAPAAGTVLRIHVAEGDRVLLGQPLVSLDTTIANANDMRIDQQLSHNRIQHYWRQGLENWLASGMRRVPVQSADHSLTNSELVAAKTMLARQVEAIAANTEVYDWDIAASDAERRAVEAEHARARATLTVLRERVAAYETLVKRQYGARVQYLEILQQQTELERTLPVLESRQQQLREAAAALEARRRAAHRELRNRNLSELAELQAAYDDLTQESRKSGLREQQLIITSPATGQVQELALHTVRGMVTAAQPIMKIVPEDAIVEIEAMLANRDIGFVHEGQRAEIKVEAFNFTKYGLLDAQVTSISDDAIQDEKYGPVFKMRLALDETTLMVDGEDVKLSPGMAVTSEIATGKRRLIEFFLSPLLRYRQESLRER